MPSRPRRLSCVGLAFLLALLLWVSPIAANWASARTAQAARPLSPPDEVHFVHTTTSANTFGDETFLNTSATNNQPGATLLVTPTVNPNGLCGCVLDLHPVGVWYNGTQWAIFNEDQTNMPIGVTFNVLVISKGAGSGWVFSQTATSSNTIDNYTLIDSPTNGNLGANLYITQNWDPLMVYNPHTVGVFYDTFYKKWAIFNEDTTKMPIGATFNVMWGAIVGSGVGEVFSQTATASNTAGDMTVIDNSVTNGRPNAMLFVTQNWNPGGTCGCIYNTAVVSVGYQGATLLHPGHWAVFNENKTSMPIGANFILLAL